MKLIGKNISKILVKDLRVKHGEFRVLRKTDEQGYKFNLQDALMLHFKFYP